MSKSEHQASLETTALATQVNYILCKFTVEEKLLRQGSLENSDPGKTNIVTPGKIVLLRVLHVGQILLRALRLGQILLRQGGRRGADLHGDPQTWKWQLLG